MRQFDDVPLPGLEYELQPRADVVTPRRRYSATVLPTAAAIERFWSRIVFSPDCWLWTGAVSGGDGYGRYRAKLHLVGYSTSL